MLYSKSMRGIFKLFAWLLLSTGVVLTSSAGLIFYNHWQQLKTGPASIVTVNRAKLQDANGQSGSVAGVETVIESDDAREIILANFLERHHSPMQPYSYFAQRLVEIADAYGIDFRLLPAISMQESNLCRNTNPDAPHNCFGWGIHKNGTLDFESYDESFEAVASGLKSKYIEERGLVTPAQIMTRYNKTSPNGAWAAGVNQFMAEMRYDDRESGRTLTIDENVLDLAKNSTSSAVPTK